MTLNQFEGRDVLQSTIRVTNAGDGLSKAMAVEPAELHHGDKVYVVLETTVDKVNYAPLKDTDCLSRSHTLKAEAGTIVDAALVSDALDRQKIAIERAQGVERLPYEGDGEE